MPVDYQSRRIVQKFYSEPKDGYFTVCLCGPVDPASFPYHSNEWVQAEYDGVVSKWEENAKMLSEHFQESLSDKMKMAIFTNMMP